MPEYFALVGNLPFMARQAFAGDMFFFIVMLRVFVAVSLTILLVVELLINYRFRKMEKATRAQRKTVLFTFIISLFGLHILEFLSR